MGNIFSSRIDEDEDLWRQLYQEGCDLYAEYEKAWNPEHLSGAIDKFQIALALQPPGDSSRRDTLDYVGLALLTRYECEGDLGDLAQAISYHEEGLALRHPDHPDRVAGLSNLANALRPRYEREGEVADLVRMIELNQQALDLCPPGHPTRSTCLNNLALTLMMRCEQEGEATDLVQVIQLHQQALDLHPPGHPDRPISLYNLATALQMRYEREEESTDLVQVIQLGEQMLDLLPPGHPYRHRPVICLANGLLTRYERKGESEDLMRAIQLYQEALDLHPLDHPDRSMFLSDLAEALQMRYKHEKKLADLTQVIQLNKLALDLRPLGHPDRSTSLGNLGIALQMKYEHEGELEDLVQAIQCQEEALDLRPSGHPSRSESLKNLAHTLLVKYKGLKGTNRHITDTSPNLHAPAARPLEPTKQSSIDRHSPDSLLGTIIALLREASQGGTSFPRDCLSAALSWIEISKDNDHDSTLDAYLSALQQINIMLAFGQSLDRRRDRLLSDDLVRGLGSEAATWAIQRGELERTVELLEQGRTMLLTQVGRYRVELDDLYRINPGLAGRFAGLSRQLDAFVLSNKQGNEEGSPTDDRYGRYRDLSTKWDQTVDQIRMLPGFDTFLKPMPYDRLRNAAAEGPIVVIVPNGSGSDALIVSENNPILHVHLPLATSDRLAKFSKDFTGALNGNDHRTEMQCVKTLKSLWKEVVGPIAQALQHDLNIRVGSRIWWCPTSVASSLPLHAAGLYSKRQPTENFLDLYVSSYTPTFQALLRARRDANTSAPKNVLVVSQPSTPDEAPLECATEEAGVITSIASPIMEVEILSGEAGIRTDVQSAMETHPWVHFICHGWLVPGQPFDSYLSLHDGHLTLRNIVERNLPNADFSFLAACHSAAGDKDLANEVLHLAAAMQFAGFRGVVGTLWVMADEDGPPLAKVFYGEMVQRRDSRGAAAALSEAVKSLRLNEVPVNRWMRFVHIGI